MRKGVKLPKDWSSCVVRTKFRAPELNEMFKYLQQKEKIYALDLLRWKDNFGKELEARSKFHEIQAHLIWMVTNIRDITSFEQSVRRGRLNGQR